MQKEKLIGKYLLLSYKKIDCQESNKSYTYILISKKFAKACLRNRYRRWIKEAIKNFIFFKNTQTSIILKKTAKKAKYQDLYKDISNLVS